MNKIAKNNIWAKKQTKDTYQSKNHRLMIKAGIIYQIASGIYSFLPHGLKALNKIKYICNEALIKAGCQEFIMPNILPISLLKESGRLNKFGNDILLMEDRHKNKLYYGPTHEEPIIDIMKSYITSYKQTPITLYQIQTKFRDELRPRGGLIRAREFLMLDAYSFHSNATCMQNTYKIMKGVFEEILNKLGLKYILAKADCGNIFGDISEEFQVLSDIGEDILFTSSSGNYAANIENAIYDTTHLIDDKTAQITHKYFQELNKEAYLCIFLDAKYQYNICKINKLTKSIWLPVSSIQNAHLTTILVDHSANALLQDYISSSKDEILVTINSRLKATPIQIVDIREVVEGDIAIDGGILRSCRGVEVGHIFQLEDHYSDKMNFKINDYDSGRKNVLMGCYGLGISRLLALCIEQYSTEDSIRWPKAINPYDLAIVAIGDSALHKARELEEYFSHKNLNIFFYSSNSLSYDLKDVDLIGCENILLIKTDKCIFKKLDDTHEKYIEDLDVNTIINFVSKEIFAF